MSELRPTPQRLALLTLLTVGCGDEATADARGTDVSDARLSRVVAAICVQELRCREVAEDEDEAPPTEQECTGEGLGYFERLRDDDPACADARLDYEECFAKLTCEAGREDDDAPCARPYAAVERRCAYGLDGPQGQ